MDSQNKILDYANKLEGLLCKYLECNYTEFGVKANGNLIDHDWKSPINFALGYRYASSNKDPKVKEDIDYFLGNTLDGNNISDIVKNYKNYGHASPEAALEYIGKTIEALEEILFS